MYIGRSFIHLFLLHQYGNKCFSYYFCFFNRIVFSQWYSDCSFCIWVGHIYCSDYMRKSEYSVVITSAILTRSMSIIMPPISLLRLLPSNLLCHSERLYRGWSLLPCWQGDHYLALSSRRSLFPQLLINRFSSFCCPSLASTAYHSEPSCDTSIQRGLASPPYRHKNILYIIPFLYAVFNRFDWITAQIEKRCSKIVAPFFGNSLVACEKGIWSFIR